MLLISGARIGDIVSHRNVYLGGVALFSLASLACGLAATTGQLITFRCVQGAGAALLVPQVMSLIQRHFLGTARDRALSAYAGVMAGGTIFGQIIGGALISADIVGSGWRPVFLVNVPIGVGLLITGYSLLPRDGAPAARRLDLPGLVVLSTTVVLFVVPLVLGHEEHWPAWGWMMLGASVLVFAAFIAVQRRVAAPLIPGHVLSAPGMGPAIAGNFIIMASFGGFLFILSLHLQSGLGDSPWESGLRFVPAALGFAAGAMAWRALPSRLQRPMILVDFTIGSLGLLLVAKSDAGGVGLELALAVVGLGIGAAFSTMTTLALLRVAKEDAADASGLLASVTPVGQVFGVATFGTLFLSLVPPSGHAMAITCGALAVASLVGACCAVPLWWQRMGEDLRRRGWLRIVLLVSTTAAVSVVLPISIGYLRAQTDHATPASARLQVRPSAPTPRTVPRTVRRRSQRTRAVRPHATSSARARTHHRRATPRPKSRST